MSVCVLHTTDGGGAGGTLLGIQVAEAVEAVGKVISGGEALPRQLLLTASAQEAVFVPRLLMIGHSTRGDWLRERVQRGRERGVMRCW